MIPFNIKMEKNEFEIILVFLKVFYCILFRMVTLFDFWEFVGALFDFENMLMLFFF